MPSNTLRNGWNLHPGHKLISNDGRTELCVQEDGKLAIYKNGECVFQNTPHQRDDIWGLRMNEDGNLRLTDTKGKIVWQTDTFCPTNGNTVFCIVQDDGNVVLYKNGNQPIWSSGTQDGHYSSGGGHANGHFR